MQKNPTELQHEVAVRFSDNPTSGIQREVSINGEPDQQQNNHLQGGHVSTEALLKLRKWLETAREAEPYRLERAPGFQLIEFLRPFCRNKTFESRLEPLHAEYLVAYYAALMEKEYWVAFCLKLQMRAFLVYTVVDELRTLFSGRFRT